MLFSPDHLNTNCAATSRSLHKLQKQTIRDSREVLLPKPRRFPFSKTDSDITLGDSSVFLLFLCCAGGSVSHRENTNNTHIPCECLCVCLKGKWCISLQENKENISCSDTRSQVTESRGREGVRQIKKVGF